MNQHHWIGIDLGGTKILGGLFDDQFRLLARVKHATEAVQGPTAVFARIHAVVEQLLTESGVDRSSIKGLGMGIPGQVDPRKGRVRYAPNLEWNDLELPLYIPKDWTWQVEFENDVRMGTYGEFTHGAARGARHVLGIFVGTGVGGGIIINGELYSGFNFNAGEIGHIIVQWRRGTSLEAIAGRRYQMKRAKKMLDDAPKRVRKKWKDKKLAEIKSSELAELYQHDDPIAVQLVDDAARALGAAVGGAVNFLNPEAIVIGGGVAGALGDTFLERIWEIAQRHVLPGAAEGVRCVPAALKDDSGIYGAAAHARNRCNGKTNGKHNGKSNGNGNGHGKQS
jgi:glucokinase